MDGIIRKCSQCSSQFWVCRSCWRGQKYCQKTCATIARCQSRCSSQKKYAQSERGRQSQRIRSRRHRLRQKSKKSETDHTPADDCRVVKRGSSEGRCSFCMNPISQFFEFSELEWKEKGHFSFRRF